VKANDSEGLLYDSTPAQRRVTLAVAVAGVVLASVSAGLSGVDWAAWQWAIALCVAFDLIGGVSSMCTPSAIRKFRPPDELLRPVLFSVFHVHPLLLALALPDVDGAVLSSIYASALLGALLVTFTPVEFRASAALAWCTAALVLVALLGTPPGLEWLAPAYLLKLVGTHAVRGQEERLGLDRQGPNGRWTEETDSVEI
jgi:hypothetical protein